MTNWLEHKLDVSVSLSFLNKTPLEPNAWADGFKPWPFTAEGLAEAINHGLTYGPVFRDGRRRKENYLRCGVVSLDFDGDVAIEEAKSHLLAKEALTIFYTTVSDTPESRRFRFVFALERPIEKVADWVALTRSLWLQFHSDYAAIDGARIFHGNKESNPEVFNRGLSSARIEELIRAGKNAFQAEDSKGVWTATGRSPVRLSPVEEVRLAGSDERVSFQSLSPNTKVHCPRHNDTRASAFVVANTKGVRGISCKACGVTYWPEEESYDFYSFDEAVKATQEFSEHGHKISRLYEPYEASAYRHLFPTEETFDDLKRASVSVLNRRFLGDLPIIEGITFIKSPKGTGKTELLASLVGDSGATVLLVGHRRALIRQMCERLGLSCYLDSDAGLPVNHRRYGVCLDSIAKTQSIDYDYVVIDESEQVLAHFLSETMETRRNSAIHRLQHLISKARSVIALDADLGWPTFRFISGCHRQHNVTQRTGVVLNEYTNADRQLRLYDSKNHLLSVIYESATRGERCYVTSNNKGLIEKLHHSIAKLVPPERVISVTSSNSQQQDIQSFLAHISQRALDYQVILTSPSVSSGVDISFEDNEQPFDHVFGIFEPLISTHFECDQQLMRVRNPKSISLYVTPSTHGFETNLDVVRDDLLLNRLMELLIDGYTPDGTPSYRLDNPLLDLACSVVSLERASKNHLRRNFKAYKERQGFKVEVVPADSLVATEAGKKLEAAAAEVWEQYVQNTLKAPQLSREEMVAVEEDVESGDAVVDGMRNSFERTSIELLYRTSISADLLEVHDRGRFKSKLLTYESLLAPSLVELEGQMIAGKEWHDPLVRVVQTRHLRVRLLRDFMNSAGLWGRAGFEWDRILDTRDLSDFIKLVGERKSVIESQFGCEVRADLAEKPISQLNTMLRFAGLKLVKTGKRMAVGEKRITTYTWDHKMVSLMKGISERRRSYPDPWLSPPFTEAAPPSEIPSLIDN